VAQETRAPTAALQSPWGLKSRSAKCLKPSRRPREEGLAWRRLAALVTADGEKHLANDGLILEAVADHVISLAHHRVFPVREVEL